MLPPFVDFPMVTQKSTYNDCRESNCASNKESFSKHFIWIGDQHRKLQLDIEEKKKMKSYPRYRFRLLQSEVEHFIGSKKKMKSYPRYRFRLLKSEVEHFIGSKKKG